MTDTETKRMLDDAVTGLLSRHWSLEAAKAWQEETLPENLWHAFMDAGLVGLGLDEHPSLAESVGVYRLAAALAAPLPLVETFLARNIAAKAGLELPDGPATVVWQARDLALAKAGTGWQVVGQVARVPWARAAAAIVLCVPHGDGYVAGVLDGRDVAIQPGRNLAGEPRDTIHCRDVTLKQGKTLRGRELEVWVGAKGACLRAAQMAGALEGALTMAVRYSGERSQFGRTLNRFQAIQQMLAALAGEVAAANAAAEAGVETLQGEDGLLACAIAKVRCGEAASKGAAIAHQVHGAMGFTREYPLHVLTRRLWSWRDEFGNERFWARWLGARLQQRGAEALWPFVSGFS